MRRRLLEAAGGIAQLAYESETQIDEVVDRAEQTFFGVTERRLSRDLRPIKQVVSEYYDRVQYLYDHQDEPLGVPTGFVDLDRLLGGMQRSDLLIVAGRPGHGQIGFLLSVAKHAAQAASKHVAIFSLEMSNEQLVQRLIAQETRIDTQRLRLGQFTKTRWTLFVHAAGVLGDTPLFLDDTPAISALELRTKCRRLHAEYSLDLVVVDYMQLMTGDTRSDNRVQEVSYISRNLKALARELNVPVLAPPNSRAPSSSATANSPCSPTCAKAAPSSRTQTWSCSSTVRTSGIMTPCARTSLRCWWRSTAPARWARSI